MQGTLPAFEYFLISYRRLWKASVASSFLLPVLFLIAMGITVGTYVDGRSGTGTGLGYRYLDFIAPGVLASTALQVAVGESTWPVYGHFTWTRIYHAMRASPLTTLDIMTGHLLYVVLRASLAATAFLVVMSAFGASKSWSAVAAPAIAVLIAIACAAPAFAYAATVSNDGLFAVLFRFAVVPMTLFAGVFFPIESLPLVVRLLAYVSPLWHGVELTRAATLGVDTAWGAVVHLAVLLVWSVGGYLLALRAFSKKLAD
jgi:lipooligosaccharide transport system permease protein